MGIYREALASLLTRRTYRGDELAVVETVVQERLGVPYAVAAPQCRVALYLVIKNTIKAGQDVVMSPYTIYDVVNMVICAGGHPKFCDVREETCNLDPAALRRTIDADTGAVIVTHLHGMAADLDEIAAICAEHNVPLVEDAAQAYGAELKGRQIGSFGESAVLSFGRAKNINAFFGGMAVTRRADVAEAMRRELNSWPFMTEANLGKRVLACAITDISTWGPVFNLFTFPLFRYACLRDLASVNRVVQTENSPVRRNRFPDKYRCRMTPMQARLAVAQHANLEKDNAHRQRLAKIYREGLRDLNSIGLPRLNAESTHIYLTFPIAVDDRMSLVKHIMRNGRDVAIQHYHNTADLECFADLFVDCPVARRLSHSIVLLPTYPGYSEREARSVVTLIRDYFAGEVAARVATPAVAS
jgi:dTDP-4-amino-4,6-dideoxygalactose transaminase